MNSLLKLDLKKKMIQWLILDCLLETALALFASCVTSLFAGRPGYLEGKCVSGWLSLCMDTGFNQIHAWLTYTIYIIYITY